MKEHNYDNLHLDGTESEQRKMVHNQIPIKTSKTSLGLGNLIGGFIALMIGTSLINTFRKSGLI